MDEDTVRRLFAESDATSPEHPPLQAIKRTARRRRNWSVGVQTFAVTTIAVIGLTLVVEPKSSDEHEAPQQQPDNEVTCPGDIQRSSYFYLTDGTGRVSPEDVVRPHVDEDAGEYMTVNRDDRDHPVVLVHRAEESVKAEVTLSPVHGNDWQADVSACAGFAPSTREHHKGA